MMIVVFVYNPPAWANWLLILKVRFTRAKESGLAEVQQLTPFSYLLTIMPKVGVGRVG